MIQGWMWETELNWLKEQAQKHSRIVELGSYLGRSTKALSATPGTVTAIDNWIGVQGADSWNLYHRFCENLAAEIKAGKVIPMRAEHKTADVDFVPDMVFIDGDHCYTAVKRDIERWKAKLAPGGLLCGHDAYDEGVRRAVQELVPDAQKVPETLIWWYELRGGKDE